MTVNGNVAVVIRGYDVIVEGSGLRSDGVH
jgi:hypothetical protein